MSGEIISLGVTNMASANPSASIETAVVRDKVRRCLALLDLLDSHIIVSLGTFSTPFDYALEQLRQHLEELAQLAAEPNDNPTPGVTLNNRAA